MQDALNVGHGVPRERAPKGRTIVVPSGNSQATLLDEWDDKPQMENQLQNPDMYRVIGESVKIFDLSKPAEESAYNDLLTKVALPHSNTFIIDTKTEVFEKTENWKVFVRMQTVQYRKIFNKKKSTIL